MREFLELGLDFADENLSPDSEDSSRNDIAAYLAAWFDVPKDVAAKLDSMLLVYDKQSNVIEAHPDFSAKLLYPEDDRHRQAYILAGHIVDRVLSVDDETPATTKVFYRGEMRRYNYSEYRWHDERVSACALGLRYPRHALEYIEQHCVVEGNGHDLDPEGSLMHVSWFMSHLMKRDVHEYFGIIGKASPQATV